MIYNDKNKYLQVSSHLSDAVLEWIEVEAQQIYSSSSKKKINISLILKDIYSQNFIPKLLFKVNFDFFSKTQLQDLVETINIRKLSFKERKQKFLNIIQKYIHQFERKKIKAKYREYLFSDGQNRNKQKCHHEIVKIILFLAIRSENKTQFIERIFRMSVQKQQLLMEQIMQVENNLQNISQKQQITLQLNTLRGINKKIKNQYQQLVDYQNQLLDKCQNQNQYLTNLQHKHQNILNQKVSFSQLINLTNTQRPYLKIYKKIIQKNNHLTQILKQKQNKQNQLYQQHFNLKNKVDCIEQVLDQLADQKKKFKTILNDKKNQSFQLQMRASLKMQSHQNCLRRSEAMRRKSFVKIGHNQKQFSNYLNRYSLNVARQSFYGKAKDQNQSMNILSKIQQLQKQKQLLAKDYTDLKTVNEKMVEKSLLNAQTFQQLGQIYNEVLNQIPSLIDNNEQSKIIQDEFNEKSNHIIKSS